MPFVYNISSKTVAENYTTSATPNTAIDAAFLKPGATRVMNLYALRAAGKAGGLSTISGIIYRLSQFFTTASSGGTSLVPTQVQKPVPNPVFTAAGGTGGGTAAVTSGTGGPQVIGGCGSSAGGPGGWVAYNPDAALALDGGANMSIDLFVASASASLNYEFFMEIQE